MLTCTGQGVVGTWDNGTQLTEVAILLQHKHQRGETKHHIGKAQTLQHPRGQSQPVAQPGTNLVPLHASLPFSRSPNGLFPIWLWSPQKVVFVVSLCLFCLADLSQNKSRVVKVSVGLRYRTKAGVKQFFICQLQRKQCDMIQYIVPRLHNRWSRTEQH